MITLVGPGGAGKTTIGAAVAARLGVAFADLDRAFTEHHGDISACLDQRGYTSYARANVELWSALVDSPGAPDVIALSSGFMVYPDDVHPEYRRWRDGIATSPTTFVLLPSLDVERSVAETVRRQPRRSFARSAEREEQVIRERFQQYARLPSRQFETMRPVEEVVADIVSAVGSTFGRLPGTARPSGARPAATLSPRRDVSSPLAP